MLDPKLIKNLAGVLSLIFAVCVLVSSGFLLSKIVPVYKNNGNGQVTLSSLTPSTTSSSRDGVENGTKNSATISGPPTTSRTSMKDIFDSSSSGNFDFSSDSSERTSGGALATNSSVMNGTKVMMNVESVGEKILDSAIGVMVRKRRAVTTTTTNDHAGSSPVNGQGSSSMVTTVVMDTICTDEWARFIGLSVGGIVVSLAQIGLYICHFWGMGKHYPPNLPLSSSAMWILINLILDMILWLLMGLSLYSSHCTRASLTKERSLFSFFVGMDATMIFVMLAFLKLTRDGGRGSRRLHNNHHNKFYDDNDEDEEVDVGNFPPLPQTLRLHTTTDH